MNEITFQTVTQDKLPLLAPLADHIWREAYADILPFGQIDYMLRSLQSVSALQEQIEREKYEYYFILYKGEIAGYIGVQDQGVKLYLSKLYLKKEFRGRGYARKAFEFCQDLAKEKGISTLFLTVNKGNTGAIAAYEAMGMTCVREQCADIGKGYVMDDFVYEYTLPL